MAVRYSLIQLRPFEAKRRAAGLGDEELQDVERALMARPDVGQVVRGTGGLRKMRFAPRSRGKGKSGSMRICYAVYPEYQRIYLVTLCSKNRQANLRAAERNTIRTTLDRIGRALRTGVEP